MSEPVARLVAATVTFEPKTTSGYGTAIPLAYQQKVTLNRSAEKKELLSNDTSMGELALELETKATYELSTEIGDVSLDNLAIAFKGVVTSKTYIAGDTYWNGKVIKASTVAGVIGDVVIDSSTLYIVKEVYAAGSFATTKCADKTYAAAQRHLAPQKVANSLGRLIVDGTNLATGSAQVLVIPLINLSYDGDVAISDTDFAKLSFKGKLSKVSGENLFTLIDA